MRMVRQTAALICCHAAARGVVIEPALAKEIAIDVRVDIQVPLGHQCVNTETLNVRAGPGADYEQLFQIPEGQRVGLWGRTLIHALPDWEEEWWGFVMWGGGEGWVSAGYLGDCPQESGSVPYVVRERWEHSVTGPPVRVQNESSEAFHEALEVDTGGARPTIYDLSTVRGRLGSLAYRCRWWLKKWTRQSQR